MTSEAATVPIPESTLSVLRKLIAHEDSARRIGSIKEAEAFAAKVQELLLKYNLDMAEMPVDDGKPSGPVIGEEEFALADLAIKNTRGRWPYFVQLAVTVARAHFCRCLLRSYRQQVVFVGDATNRQVAMQMLIWLSVQMESLAVEAWQQRDKANGHVDPWRFRCSFYLGFVARIDQRYYEERTKHATSTAIVVRSHDEAIKTFIAETHGRLGASRTSSGGARSAEGWSAGHRAGGSVTLRGGAQISGARGLLK